jgi:hypothetical protein
MLDQDLDKIAEKWAEEEAASAPKMRPTAEMYERVAALGRRRSLGALLARRPAWAAAAAVVVVCVLAFAIVQLAPLVVPGGGPQVAYVSQREAFVTAKGGPPVESLPGGKGPDRGPPPFPQIVFQVYGPGAPVVRSVDVMAAYTRPLVLAAEESYRLVLESAEARYVYVYQQTPAGALVSLYPNAEYSPATNPIPAAERVYLPVEPNGFYLEDAAGVSRLYVVAAEEPLPELESLYARYRRRICFDRGKRLELLRQRLDVIVSGQEEGVCGWTLEFEVR